MNWDQRQFFIVLDIRVLSLLVLLLLISCEDNLSVVRDETFNDPFSLKVGETVRLQPDNLIVGFQKVINDSRCPSNARCIWEGIADLQLWILKLGLDTAYVKASIYGYVTKSSTDRHLAVEVLGYRMTVLQLDPYPGTHIDSSLPNYVATIRVSKI